jgi:hypothetical protein
MADGFGNTQHFYGDKAAPNDVLSLSLHIAPLSFQYAISSQDFKQVHEIGHATIDRRQVPGTASDDEVRLLVQQHFLHQKKFSKVNIALLNNEFTMVPEAYAGEGDIRSLLGFTTGAQPVKNPLSHRLRNTRFCFAAHNDTLAYLERTFTNASIRHSGAVSLALLFSQHSLAGSDLYLNVGEGIIELAARRGSEILFYNAFNTETGEDILYYLLFTMEQFGLDPLVVKLSVAAQLPADNELFRQIRRYIKHVAFCVGDPSIKLSGELQELPAHYYFTLLNQHLCEL